MIFKIRLENITGKIELEIVNVFKWQGKLSYDMVFLSFTVVSPLIGPLPPKVISLHTTEIVKYKCTTKLSPSSEVNPLIKPLFTLKGSPYNRGDYCTSYFSFIIFY